jgi:hypothetical protein
MAYEKPKLVDISKQQERGSGGTTCSGGSGDVLCFNGSTAGGCDVGSGGQGRGT